MRVTCPICWSDHPKWECKASANKSTAARKDVPENAALDNSTVRVGGSVLGSTPKLAASEPTAGNQALPVDISIKRPVGRPKTITDMKAYKAAKAKEYRAKAKAIRLETIKGERR